MSSYPRPSSRRILKLDREMPMKTCSCGQHYTAEEWKGLPYVGRQDDEVEHIELRLCSACGTTLGVVLWTAPQEPS